jgi:hypothetical protein
MSDSVVPARLSKEMELDVAYARSKDGRPRVIPVWFTINGGKIELLPMYGVKTKWFIDVEKSGSLELRSKGWKKAARPSAVRNSEAVEGIKRRFSLKYGTEEVKRYYPTSEVALEIQL